MDTDPLGTFENPFPEIRTPEQFNAYMENYVLPGVKKAKERKTVFWICVPENKRKLMMRTIDAYLKINNIPRSIHSTLKIVQEEKV